MKLQSHKLAALLALLAVGVLISAIAPSALRGALFQINPSATPPVTGLYLSRGYEAQPNERGSVLVQAGETLTSFEGLELTFIVDPSRATILRARRTAVTQQFEISVDFPAPGVAHVALVGAPRQINAGVSLLEFELDLVDSSVNTTGNRVDLRLLDVSYLSQGNQVGRTGHNGLVTIITNQDALELPFLPYIADVDPAVYPLVQKDTMTIRGKAFPPSPRVLLGARSIPVLSASTTEVIASIPEDTAPGTYTVAVESLLADETIVIYDVPGPSGSVEILDGLLFATPNPVLFNADENSADIVLWVPVHNPLGSEDPVAGSVDFSEIGGDPNIIFSGIGTPAVGPGGEMVNWFRIPESGTFTLPSDLETNADYPIDIRVENRSGTRDIATMILELRSQIPRGDAPSFGTVETVPASPIPGDNVSFFVDVTDQDGVENIQLVSLRLTSVGGSVKELSPVLSGVPLTTVPYSTDFTLAESVSPATYQLEFTAIDAEGNRGTLTYNFVVSAPGQQSGTPPQFSGRLEARPAATGPGADVDFFAGVRHPNGTKRVKSVTIDLISIGGGVQDMASTENLDDVGSLPVVFETNFQLPSTLVDGTYPLTVRAVDMDGLSAQATINLTINASLGGGGTGGTPPIFPGRLEAVPGVVGFGGQVIFYVDVSDPDGTSTINQVTLDLTSLGGVEQPEMEPLTDPVAGSVQPVTYKAEFSVPTTIVPGIKSVPVRAIDNEGNATSANIPVTVSAITQPTGLPTVIQLFATPSALPADDDTPVFFTAVLEDSDGIDDIEVVRINLAPLDLPGEDLSLESGSSSTEGKRGTFTSSQVRIPRSVESAVYNLIVDIEDSTGNRVTQALVLNVGSTLVGGDPPRFKSSRFIPESVRPGGDVRLFVEIIDPNGTEDVTVIADFTEIELEVEELDELIDFPAGTFMSQSTFDSDTQRVPKDLRQGVYDIPLLATDPEGHVVRTVARLRVERGGLSEGSSPRINTEKSFQTPRVFMNDGENNGEFHVLVEDVDEDIVGVIANLGAAATAGSSSIRSDDIDFICGESRAIVCLAPSVPEGVSGRWYIIEDIAIPPSTQASSDPYYIEVTAFDKEGHTSTVRIPFMVGGPDAGEALTVQPEFLLVVPVNDRELELVVSSPVDPNTVDRGGTQLEIQPTLDAFTTINVNRISWDTTGRFLYLQTNPILPGETYNLTVDSAFDAVPLVDVNGNRFTRDHGGTISFTGYEPNTEPPKIKKVSSLDSMHLNVTFDAPVLPSSVHPDLLSSRVHLESLISGERRKVKTGFLKEDGRTLSLQVDDLQEGDRYLLRISGVTAPGLIQAPPPGVEKVFIVVFPRGDGSPGSRIFPTADLNHDGKVDFADFALFSSVYGTDYDPDNISGLLRDDSDSADDGAPTLGSPFRGAGSNRNQENVVGGELPKLEF